MPVSPLENMPDFSDFNRLNQGTDHQSIESNQYNNELDHQSIEPNRHNNELEQQSIGSNQVETEIASQAEINPSPQEAEREKVVDELNHIKDQIMQLRSHLIADSHQFDAAFSDLDEMMRAGNHIDPDRARTGLKKLLQAHQDLIITLSHFKSSNTDYLKQTLLYRKTLGEASYQREYSSAEDNKEQADSVYRKMQVREDEIQRLKNIVRTIEESLWL